MADELCGPSNALQNFQKHATGDRTLQQDRLTAQPLPSQGFRSSPAAGSGLLESEFQAFQAGQPPLQQINPYGTGRVVLLNTHTRTRSQLNPAAAAWTGDFQRLTPGSQLQPHGQVHRQVHPQQVSGGWHGEFVQQQVQPQNWPHAINHGYNGAVVHPNLQPMPQAQVPQTTDAFDEEAFARAFEEAAMVEAALADAPALDQAHGSSPDAVLDKSTEASSTLQHERIGSDLIEQAGSGNAKHDPDALAITAGQLLERVQDNQSEKFRNSKFLQLMRQLRDRQVTVDGDKIVSGDSEAAEATPL